MPEKEADDEKERKLGLIEVGTLRNLVDIAGRSMFQFIHHIKFREENLYYIQFGGLPVIGTTIYFFRQKETINEKYIVYNQSEDKISYTNELDSRGNLKFFPIIHIKKQNIFADEELAEFLEK